MSTELDPIVGNWYRDLNEGQLFFVVAFDEQSGVIEVQCFDGGIDEVVIHHGAICRCRGSQMEASVSPTSLSVIS